MATYLIRPHGFESYDVEVTETTGIVRVQGGFENESDAQLWIDQQKKMSEAADRFEGYAPRRWR